MNELQMLMQEAAKHNPEALREMLRRLSTEEKGSASNESPNHRKNASHRLS